MRIAVCDDEVSQVALLEKLLSEWAKEHKIAITVVPFFSGEEFIFHWEDDKEYDLLILDIEMGKMNGMEMAKKIRQTDEQLPILFITGYDDYMAQGYEVAAIHYLLKPVNQEKLFEVLDRVQKKEKQEERLFFQGKEGNLGFLMSQIWYVEALGHQCVLYTKEKEWTLRQSISEVEEYLCQRKEFIRCHRSYLINLQHVSALIKTEVILDNNKRLPLSRSASKKVNEAFIRNFQKVYLIEH